MSNDKIDFCLKDFKNILFDLDGTLSDPKEGIINSYKYALKKLNIDEENPDSLTEFIGTSLQNCFTNKYGLKDNELSSAIIYYREYFSEKELMKTNYMMVSKNYCKHFIARIKNYLL